MKGQNVKRLRSSPSVCLPAARTTWHDNGDIAARRGRHDPVGQLGGSGYRGQVQRLPGLSARGLGADLAARPAPDQQSRVTNIVCAASTARTSRVPTTTHRQRAEIFSLLPSQNGGKSIGKTSERDVRSAIDRARQMRSTDSFICRFFSVFVRCTAERRTDPTYVENDDVSLRETM
ncbi:unnamed protein product [Trichogramma brassicae]|uniref:Uncharacterized protein n=1 Tax=Trichogramma brassicae TaxID=86971 RepID=A0A6H5ISF9_9HYME|nr:unnamed protein product [Trichogramma brassicae]